MSSDSGPTANVRFPHLEWRLQSRPFGGSGSKVLVRRTGANRPEPAIQLDRKDFRIADIRIA